MIEIRFARVSDAPELERLNTIFNGEGFDYENCNTVEGIEGSLNNNNREIVCVAAEGDKLHGFCCGQIFSSMCFTTSIGEVTEFFVESEYRRHGIGRKLMTLLESVFENHKVGQIRVLTGSDNLQARAFYVSCGYTETDEFMLEKVRARGLENNHELS